MDSDNNDIHISAKLQKGVPDLRIELHQSVIEKIADAALKQRDDDGDGTGKKKITISLEHLDIDLLHNQSFGMMQASTGCASNPGGPGC